MLVNLAGSDSGARVVARGYLRLDVVILDDDALGSSSLDLVFLFFLVLFPPEAVVVVDMDRVILLQSTRGCWPPLKS